MKVFVFSVDPLCEARLVNEIIAARSESCPDGIIPQFTMTRLGSAVTFTFRDDLSSDEEALLAATVAVHTGEPMPSGEQDSSGNPIVALATPKDSDGAFIIQPKTTKLGWHYDPRCINFVTGQHGSLHNHDHTEQDIGDAVLKFFDENDDLLTQGAEESDEDYQTRLDANCAATAVDWWPQYSADFVGGLISAVNPPDYPQRAYGMIIIAPDIPAVAGGSVPFGNGGFNLEMLIRGVPWLMDGKGVKTFNFDPVYKSNKVRIILHHSIGLKLKFQIVYQNYHA